MVHSQTRTHDPFQEASDYAVRLFNSSIPAASAKKCIAWARPFALSITRRSTTISQRGMLALFSNTNSACSRGLACGPLDFYLHTM